MNYNNRIEKFINEFNDMLNKDIYINKKMVDCLFDKNKILMSLDKISEDIDDNLYNKCIRILNEGYRIVNKHNEKFINDKLVEYKIYFDDMFKNIDYNIILDEEQRRAILIDEDYSLVIAGAGSGKTTTMAAKVKYLVDKCGILPRKIILLAYTNKSADELAIRINEDFKLDVEVLTFHKLGMRFLRKIFDKPISVTSNTRLKELIIRYVKEIVFSNQKKLSELILYFNKYVHFDEDVLEYNNFDNYFKNYADKLYYENIDNLKDYNNYRIESRYKIFRTINGEIVKSIGEVKIANYLYTHGYSYSYEKTYPHTVAENRSYSPDFTVHDNGVDFYIEYYGITKYRKDGSFSLDDVNAYNKLIEKKRQLHKKYKTDLIELYHEYEDDREFISELKKALESRNSLTVEKTDKEIFYRLLYTNTEIQYYKFINLVEDFINRFKEKGYEESTFEIFIEKEKDELIKKQLKFVKPIFRYYQNNIHQNYEVDFNDMITYGYKGMDNLKKQNRYLDYDYLIIDEYQDISIQRYNFAKKLSDLFTAKIVAVGDDWQAIFGFSGSEVELFTKFYELLGYAEISKITKTYRNSQELIDVAGEFVSKNEEQFKKNLSSVKHLENPIQINYYDIDDLESKNKIVLNTIKKIVEENPKGNILLLGRFNDDIDELLTSKYLKKGASDSIICNLFTSVKIDFLTVHSSKGLGYDNVILLNAISGTKGFPSQIKDQPLIKILEPKCKEPIEFPEERRLFYVALTRTKNKLYIICPEKPSNKKSEFVREIVNNKNVEEVFTCGVE